MAHPLKPVVQVGVEGLTEAVGSAVDTALYTHELVKVRLGQSYAGDRREAAEAIAAAATAQLVQLIGRVIVLYRRRSKDLPDRPRLQLPA
jgi:RNA-binding protein